MENEQLVSDVKYLVSPVFGTKEIKLTAYSEAKSCSCNFILSDATLREYGIECLLDIMKTMKSNIQKHKE